MGELPETPAAPSPHFQQKEQTTVDTVLGGNGDVKDEPYRSCLGKEEPLTDQRHREQSKPLSIARKELLKNMKKLREMDRIQVQILAGEHVDPLQLKKVQGRAEVEGKVEVAQRLVDAEDVAKQREEEEEEEDAGGWWPLSGAPAEIVFAGAVCSTPAEAASLGPLQAPFTVWQDPSVQWSLAAVVPDSWPSPAAEIACRIHQAQLQAEERAKPPSGWLPGGAGLPRHEGAGSERRWDPRGPACLEQWRPPQRSHATALASLAGSLQAGGRQQEHAVAELSGTILQRSLHPHGCRDVQLALTVLDRRTSGKLVAELHGHVRELVGSPFGNYVIQKVIEVMTPEQASFVVAELQGVAIATARHRYGCRILCRLLEHSTGDEGLAMLLDELLLMAEFLCKHPFAHHVTQSILEHGRPEHRRRVCQALCSDPRGHACDRHGSFVLEAAFANCAPVDQEALAAALLPDGPHSVLALAKDRFGSHVIRALLKSSVDGAEMVLFGIHQSAAQIMRAKHGRQFLRDVGISDSIGIAATDSQAAMAAAAAA